MQTNTGDGGAFVDFTGTTTVITNNVAANGSFVNLPLPVELAGKPDAKIRFFLITSVIPPATDALPSTGSRPKISIDNLVVTTGTVTPPVPAATITTTASAFNSPYCITATAGSTPFNVAYTSSGTFTGGFKVQLSNALGVFPTNVTDNIIGSGTSSPIAAVIPPATPSGTKYRVRVINDAPATYGTNNGSDLTVSFLAESNPVTVTPATVQSVITTGTGETLTASAAVTSTFSWLYSTSTSGTYTAIGGATTASYTVRGVDFPGVGTYYVVAQATLTTDCGTVPGQSAPITVTVSAPPTTPALLVSASTLADFGNLAVGAGTGLKSFTVEGNNLTSGIIITPPAGFEIRTGNNPFACCTIELQPAGGNVPSTTIDVRFAPAAPQAYSESIPVTSAGLPNQSVAVTGTGVNPVYPATLSTTAVTELTPTSATTGGTVAADGGSAVTARGVVWAKTPNPTIAVTTKTADVTDANTFTSAIKDLVPGTTYFVRAYATNGVSTAYGQEISFTTVTVPLAAEPTTQAKLTASQVTSTSLQLNLAGVDGKKHLIIARRGSAVDAEPTDATTYTANAEFGKGSVLDVGNFVVYNGTGDNVTITGLRANATYHFSVFAFNDNDLPYAENYLLTDPGVLIQKTSAAPAALLLEENFDYAAGSLLTANNWTAHDAGGTNSIAVTAADGLSYSEYSANSGKAAATVGSGEDINRQFAEPVYAGTPVYTSLLVNVKSVSTADYFFHLGPSSIGSTFRARLYTRPGVASGTVQFGISSNGTAAAIKYTTVEYPLNTTHLVVIKYDYDEAGATTKLFVNPAAGAEPAMASAEASEMGNSPANIGAVAIRQGANVPKLTIDGIRVGNSYRVVRTGLVCLEPVPAFTAATVCAGSATAFTNTSTVVESNATYAWDVESDGKVDYTNAGNISHTYAAAGTYTATLIITQGACSATYTQKVTVRELPTATLSGDATVCVGTPAKLTVQLTGIAPWTVGYSANGVAAPTPLIVTAAEVDANGNYTFDVAPKETTAYALTSLTDANCNGAALTGSATVTITTPPTLTVPATLTANTDNDKCGASVAFAATAMGTPAPELVYSIVKNGVSTTITSPYFFPVGTTTVKVTATNSCGTDVKIFAVTVQDKQVPTVLTQNISVTLSNGTASITAALVNNGSLDACGIASMTLSKSIFSCENIGLNKVTLTVTDIHGNVASQTADVDVKGTIPNPVITYTPSSTVYTGGVPTNLYLGYGPQKLTLNASGGKSYQWSPAAGLSSASIANPVFTATTAGTFTYTLTVANEFGCVATKTVTIKVTEVRDGKKNPKIQVCHNGQAVYVNLGEVESHLLNHKEQLGNCSSNTLTASAAATAVTTEFAATANVFEAYPNPFTERATLRFRAAETGKAQMLVYNSVGKLVATIYDGVAEGGRTYEFTVEGASLAEGVYTCRLTTSGKIETKRLVLVK
ncbi:PKD domain-containing protein [Hymenobacter sp. HDW8]|uniref:PKD domain-containing protein n=1 Tax=Hymenobacter sp. HDW8 TaxID=2714932 RepID=UPI0014085E01|nr:PKD domain-containing protein [Hymenobacter sp. HDW8]QIL76606.1 T9SS type A sorting domain-containing protein [Hymenobacter sp. HDW8]